MTVETPAVHDATMSSSATARRPGSRARRLDLIQRVALPAAWVVMIIGFGIASPNTSLTAANFQTMLGSQAVLLVLTLALIVPLTAGGEPTCPWPG